LTWFFARGMLSDMIELQFEQSTFVSVADGLAGRQSRVIPTDGRNHKSTLGGSKQNMAVGAIKRYLTL
jgi:hypothetical protein